MTHAMPPASAQPDAPAPTTVTLTKAPVPPDAVTAIAAIEKLGDALATVDDRDHAIDLQKGVREMVRTIDAHYDAITKPIRAALDTANAMRTADLAPWKKADPVLTGLITTFERKRKEAEAAAAEARRRQDEADAAAQRAQQVAALQAAAKAADDAATKKALNAQAREVKAAPLPMPPRTVAAPAKAPVAGTSISTTHRAEVVDEDACVAAAALALVLRTYLPAIVERVVRDVAAESKRRALANAIIVAAAEVAGEVATPPREALTVDLPVLNKMAVKLGASLAYPGVRSVVVESVRHRR